LAENNLTDIMALKLELENGIVLVLGIGVMLGTIGVPIIIVVALEMAVCTVAIAKLTVLIEHFCLIQFF
jgi:hypothetical protein